MAILQKNVVLDTNGSNPHHFTAWRIYIQYLADQRQYDRARALLRQAERSLGEQALAKLRYLIPN